MQPGSFVLIASLGIAAAVSVHAASDSPDPGSTARSQYPTAVVADYVLGCLLANGQTPEVMRKCACSFDFIAAAIPYEEYEKVETLLRMQQTEGAGRTAAFKGSAWAKAAIAHFRDVQAESTLRCF